MRALLSVVLLMAGLKAPQSRKPAALFTLPDNGGKQISLSEYAGKVVLLDFWATWCVPCKTEMPWFSEFASTYGDKGFAVLGVSLDRNGWEVIQPFLQKTAVSYPILLGNDEMAHQYGGAKELPTTVLIDREGRVAAVHTGITSRKTLESEIVTLLSSPAASGR